MMASKRIRLGFENRNLYGVSTWTTSNTSTGSSNSDQLKLPLESSGDYDFIVYWGDGTSDHITAYDQSEVTHTYASSGTYEVSFKGKLHGFLFNNTGDRLKIGHISKWGDDFKLSNSAGSFYGCQNLTLSEDAGFLNCEGLTTLENAFRDCDILNTSVKFKNYNDVLNANRMLYSCPAYNQPILLGGSNIQQFIALVAYGTAFNQRIDNIINSNTTTINALLYNCPNYNQPFNQADTSNVFNTGNTFRLCSSFNQDLSMLNYEAITSASDMLIDATSWTTENYDKFLVAVASQDVGSGISFGCSSYYTLGGEAQTAHDYLTDTKLWSITDLGGV